MKKLLFFALIVLPLTSFAKNLQLIQEDVNSGFAIYRTGKPSYSDMKELCKKGITEIAVLSGNAADYEFENRRACPSLKVVFNEKTSSKVALTTSFLEWFDNWVEEAKRTGKKIAFRCNCGCHRTGRLAAYYQMKYQNITSTDAWVILKKHGKWMFFHKKLIYQIRALEDYIQGRECTQNSRYCVKED